MLACQQLAEPNSAVAAWRIADCGAVAGICVRVLMTRA
jgi:hypothetical protein